MNDRARLHGVSPMLHTDDMRGTIRFYTDVLGFRLGGAWPENEPCWCDVCNDAVHVMFTTQNEEGCTSTRMTGRIYFYTDNVLEIFERIKDKTRVIEGPEVRFYGMKEIAVMDNNGYVLAFGQDTDEPPTCREE